MIVQMAGNVQPSEPPKDVLIHVGDLIRGRQIGHLVQIWTHQDVTGTKVDLQQQNPQLQEKQLQLPSQTNSQLNQLHVQMPIVEDVNVLIQPKVSKPTLFGWEMSNDVSQFFIH